MTKCMYVLFFFFESVSIHCTEVIRSHHTIFAPVPKVIIALTKFKSHKKGLRLCQDSANYIILK